MKRKKWLFISAAIAAGFAFAFWRLSGCIETMGPKHGRVIDRDSGLGVAGVSIVAEGYFNATGPWESVHHCTFVQMTATDEQGYYRFPGAYSHWFATGKANLGWSMYVSKNGYAPADLPWPMEYREDDRTPVGNFYWRSNSDAFHMDGWTAEVAPLQIKRVDAKIQERIWLLSMSGLWKSCDFDMTSEQRAALRTEFADIEQRACHASGDERISAAALEKLRDEAAPRPGPFIKARSDLLRKAAGFWQRGFTMDQLCSVMQAGEPRQ